MSPSASTSAFLQSMKPAPVRSRSSLTFSAEMSAMFVRVSCFVARAATRVGSISVGPRRGSDRGGLFLLCGFASELRGDLLGGGLRRGRGGIRGGDRASARQQILVLGIRLERQRGATLEGGDELVRRGFVEFRLGAGGDLRLRLRRGARGAFLLPLEARVGDQRAEQADRPDRVVVGGDDVVDLVG